MLANSIYVSLVCCNPIVGEGLKAILLEEDFVVTGQHRNCRALIAAAEQDPSKIGLVLIDAGVSRNVSQEVGMIHSALPDARVVVLHEDLRVDSLVEVFEAGADGYVLKEISCESLVSCLHLAAQGEKVVPGCLVDQLPHYAVATADQVRAEGELSELLSEREIETLRCLVMGYPNKVIARRLDIGEATVKVHVKAILRKLMVQNRTQAAIWAVNHGVQATLPPSCSQPAEANGPTAEKTSEKTGEKLDAEPERASGSSFMLADSKGTATPKQSAAA